MSVLLPVSGASTATVIESEVPWQEGRAARPDDAGALPVAKPTRAFFTDAEAAFVEASVARLIPDDELGPGALQAGVAHFIDLQLAGEYGRAARWYMQGPWAKGEPTQGWQTRLTPAAMYRAAIHEIDEAATRETHQPFARLAAAQQDAWLHRLEDGKLDLPSVDAKAFFKLLWQNTLEGFWSDPIYGGNRGMAGWKLIGFPGARYDQSLYVRKHGEPYPLPPVGLRGRPEWTGSA
jgi:gluconate 2-dehydrogenase gamma chain